MSNCHIFNKYAKILNLKEDDYETSKPIYTLQDYNISSCTHGSARYPI